MSLFENKIILITGGTGTIGSALVKRLANSSIREIRIFSRDEKKQEDMRMEMNNSKIVFFIGDVRDISSLELAMQGVDYVFHAAAMKQVSSCENFPMEAFKTNVIGADNVLSLAIRHGVRKAIVLSTDKAVYPTGTMGTTKAMMEKLMLAKSKTLGTTSITALCGTRFGNVLVSRASVIPRFIQQIKLGSDICLTDPQMTRFMMSVDEAIDLILAAFEHAENGDIFLRKSPCVRLGLLAQALLELYNSSVKIRIEGVRGGEKLSESLLSDEELDRTIIFGNYFRIRPHFASLDSFSLGSKMRSDFQSQAYKSLDLESTKKLLMSLDMIKKDILS
ncbi:epimerase/dehydratase [Bacteroidales bacterium]|nr:epimerase/dehydratase [Bacteroidales bacterium]